ncbi:hypothetical protein QG37_05700 [Candidozyma auris]|nr:hypothetical protein QG37_05700 [[Candida] auris]
MVFRGGDLFLGSRWGLHQEATESGICTLFGVILHGLGSPIAPESRQGIVELTWLLREYGSPEIPSAVSDIFDIF